MRDLNSINKLINIRRKIIGPLLTLIILLYFSFISIIAFNPSFFARNIFNSSISLGITTGLLLIIVIFAVTLVYSVLANKYLEPLIKKIVSNHE
jgi:uncharacterized membrane protein (DUF485 family)